MNRKLAIAAALLSLMFVTGALATPSSAVSYVVGVKPGDRADYEVSGYGYDRMGIVVNTVSGTIVNITEIYYYSNGTILSEHHSVGNVSEADFDIFLLPAGLGAGDPIFSGTTEFIWNGTTTMNVAGSSRVVDYLFADEHNGRWRLYTDQATGMIAKFEQPSSYNYTMISTNMWGAIDPAVLILIGGGAAAVAVIAIAAVLISRRRK